MASIENKIFLIKMDRCHKRFEISKRKLNKLIDKIINKKDARRPDKEEEK